LPYGPFASFADYQRWVEHVHGDNDMVFYAIVNSDPATLDREHSAVGVLSLLRMQPEVGVIEVGHVHYSPQLQRTRAATEAQYLLASHVFAELGYRRYEWKCDTLNAASRAAAERLGFTYGGARKAGVRKYKRWNGSAGFGGGGILTVHAPRSSCADRRTPAPKTYQVPASKTNPALLRRSSVRVSSFGHVSKLRRSSSCPRVDPPRAGPRRSR
jgi:RimJ/RimL family protein N-acetyltransferase